MATTNIQNLLQKNMTRKEFIATVGLGVASVTGFSTIVSIVSKTGVSNHKATNGYGSGYYG